MDSMDDTDPFARTDDDDPGAGGGDELFGSYSVLSPGVQIVLHGRSVSAPIED